MWGITFGSLSVSLVYEITKESNSNGFLGVFPKCKEGMRFRESPSGTLNIILI
jgi:hypothetical protein